MDDLISRQAAIDLLKQMRKDGNMVPWEGKDVFDRIRKLPSVQPEPHEERTETHACDLISRAGKKDASTEVEDLQKAVWYINRRIEQIRKGNME